MRRAAKIDAFHREVRAVFVAHGIAWCNTPIGAGFPDALVAWGGRLALLEIKSGRKGEKATKAKTAQAQQAFAMKFPVRRVTCLEEATATIHWLKTDGLTHN